jgi:hypothetical protein
MFATTKTKRSLLDRIAILVESNSLHPLSLKISFNIILLSFLII